MLIPLRQKTILVIFGLFLTLIILETGLRLGGFIILSLQERRNLLSIRQRGEYRIICLGESTTQREYPAYLEEILNQRNSGIKFSVIDKGIAGANTGFIVAQLEANLDKYQPDLVVTMMGINDSGHHMPYAAGSTTQIKLFFKSFRIYKLTRLLWLRIITKAIEQDNFIQQETRFKKALELNPQTYRAYVGLGWLYVRQGKLTEAEQAFKKAIELNHSNDEAYAELGWFYLRQGKDTEAEQPLKKALELNPQTYRTYTGLGELYRRQGKDTEAEQLFKKALELNPRNNEAYAELGWLYINQGKHTKAEQALKNALKLNPQNDRAYGSLAVLYGEMGNYMLRKEYEEKAKQIRERFYNPITINHYRRCKQILKRRKVGWICVQYPVRSVEPLKRIFQGENEGIIFVGNEEIFKSVVLREGYKEYFRDVFGGDFGHCTKKGNRLLAENIANAILKEVFHK